MTKLFYTEQEIDKVREHVIGYLKRNKISPTSLAALIGVEPQTLSAFLKKTKKPQTMKIYTIQQWLEEYDHVDFRIK